MNSNTPNRHIALLIMRLLLGFIFLMQGFGKVFTWGVENVYKNFFYDTYNDLLPDFLVHATAYYTSFIELLGGLCLIVGFKRDIALYLLATVLIIVTFGHGLAEPIWDLSHVMYRAILLIGLLLLPRSWDVYTVDHFLANRK
ncbi:MAG: DoxX family protein [Saprospiraceae bacterium]|nr:DoxX family protein [Saprospiraceae bacterium]